LPKVDPQLVANCRAGNARFGQSPVSRRRQFHSRAVEPDVIGPCRSDGNPPSRFGGRGTAVPYPGQENAPRPPTPMAEQRAVISSLPPDDQPETGPAKSLPPQFRGR